MTGATDQQGAAGPTPGPGRGRYLVGADDPALLRELAARISAADEATLIRTVDESTLVIEATPDYAERLGGASEGHVVVEPDRPVRAPESVLPPGFSTPERRTPS